MSTEPFLDNELIKIFQLIEEDRAQGMERLRALAALGNASAILYYALNLAEEYGQSSEEIYWLIQADELGFPGIAYHGPTDARSFRAMLDLFDEVLSGATN